MDDRAAPSLARSTRALAFLFLAAALALGAAKVVLQKRSPPSWAAAPIHRIEGYVAIDGFGQRAAWLRERIGGEEPGQAPAGAPDLSLHPCAWLVPLAVALASFATGSIPLAFALLSALASAAEVLLVAALARRLDPARRAEVGWLAALAAAGHCLTMRTAVQLTLDPFCAAWSTAVLLLSLRWAEERRPRDLVGLAALETSGLFLKASFLPVLAFPTLALWIAGERGARRFADTFLLTALLPAALALAFQRAFVPGTSPASDLAHLAASWNPTPRGLGTFALEMALLLQFYPLALAGRARSRPELAGLVALCLLLASTWAFGFPAVPRLYLPALGLLVALSVPRLHASLGPRAALGLLAAAGLLNLGIGLAGLWLAS